MSEKQTDTIERTADEIAQALRAVDSERDQNRFGSYEYDALRWLLDGDYEYTPPRRNETVEIGVTATEVREYMEELDEHRKAAYAANQAPHADGMAFMQSTFEWALGENDAYDHVIHEN